jgi:sulfate permease, SulP family
LIFRKAGKVTERYEKPGKTVYIRHLDSSSRVLLVKAEKIIHVNYTDDDPAFKIVLEEDQVMG